MRFSTTSLAHPIGIYREVAPRASVRHNTNWTCGMLVKPKTLVIECYSILVWIGDLLRMPTWRPTPVAVTTRSMVLWQVSNWPRIYNPNKFGTQVNYVTALLIIFPLMFRMYATSERWSKTQVWSQKYRATLTSVNIQVISTKACWIIRMFMVVLMCKEVISSRVALVCRSRPRTLYWMARSLELAALVIYTISA
jgi:hypothetical protein